MQGLDVSSNSPTSAALPKVPLNTQTSNEPKAAVWDASLASLSQAINDALPACIAYLDENHCYRFVNAAYERVFQRDRKSILGCHLSELVGQDAYLRLRPSLDKAFSGATAKVSVDFLDPSGYRRYFEGVYTPAIDEQGQISGVIVFQNDVSDRREAEQILAERETQLQLALDIASMGTCEVDLLKDIVIWDEQHQRIFGCDPKDEPRTMRDFENFLHPEDRESVMNAIAETIEKGLALLEHEFRIVHPRNGAIRWIQAKERYFYDQDGKAARIIGISKDLTDQKLAEQMMAEEQNRIRVLLDQMPQLIWTTDPQGNTVYANRRCLEYTGMESASKQDYGWLDSVHENDRKALRKKWDDAIAANTVFEAEYRIVGAQGEARWFLGRAIPVRDENNSVKEWFGTATDIHERKLAEERRDRIQRKVSQLHTTAAALATTIGPEEVAQVVVEHAQNAIAASAGVVAIQDGERVKTLFAKGYPPGATEKYEDSLMDSHTPLTLSIRSKTPVFISNVEEAARDFPHIALKMEENGRRSLCAFPLLVQGQAIGAIGLSFEGEQDFSQERISYLTILAEQGAQAIERARLFAAEKKARETAEIANLAKTQFLANISHEIRTPMNAILGFSDLLNDKALTPDEHETYCRRIRTNGDQLLRLIDDVLDLSKVEAGKMEFEILDFSIIDLVRDVYDSLSVVVEKKGIATRLILEKDIPSQIASDPLRLRQILTNLLGNAAKFTDKGIIETRIALEMVEGHAGLVIDVRDSGVGIAKEMQKKLFQSFAQADSSVTRRFGGTGLGLVLSRGIAEALGGSLTLFASEPGVGSTFRLTLPLKEKEAMAHKHPNTEAVPAVEISQALEGVKILLVDDALDNELLIRAYLKKTGAKLEAAHSGHEAVACALAQDYDVILMDIQMPGMDGLEATRLLRQSDYQKPIIALSAHALEEEVKRSLEAGCQAHLTKPVTRSALIQEILSVLNSAGKKEADRGLGNRLP